MTCNALGLFVGMVLTDGRAGLALATIVAQTSLVVAGFYRTLPIWMHWVRYLSIPYYVFSALVKTEFSWTDTTECHPSQISTRLGHNRCYIETTNTFENFRLRYVLSFLLLAAVPVMLLL